MVDQGRHAYWVILLSFVAAAWLAIIPLPDWLVWARPEWPALVLIYWVIALPHRVSLFTGLLLGIYIDVLEGAVLGQNALSLTVVAYLAWILYQRLRVFNVLQQSSMVFMLVGVNQLLCQWVQNLTAAGADTPMFLLPALTSALLWPVILHILRHLRRQHQVA
jgi:rod shape-determining protein MreD